MAVVMWIGRKTGEKEVTRILLRRVNIFIILFVAKVPQPSVCVKIYQVVYFKHMQLIECALPQQSYLGKLSAFKLQTFCHPNTSGMQVFD